MKFRTDFVTNSSSSSFVVEITFKMTDGSQLQFLGPAQGGEGEGFTELYLTKSPKNLGLCKSVHELVKMLASSVLEKEDEYDDGVPIFDLTDDEAAERRENAWNAEYYERAKSFVEKVSDISNIEDIQEITIKADRINGDARQYRSFTYQLSTKNYSGLQSGEFFEDLFCGNGSSGGDLLFNDLRSCRIDTVEEEDIPDLPGLGTL